MEQARSRWVVNQVERLAPTGHEATLDDVMAGVAPLLSVEAAVKSGTGMFFGLVVSGPEYAETVQELVPCIRENWSKWEALVRSRFGAEVVERLSALRGLPVPRHALLSFFLEGSAGHPHKQMLLFDSRLVASDDRVALRLKYRLRLSPKFEAESELTVSSREEFEELALSIHHAAQQLGRSDWGLYIRTGPLERLAADWKWLRACAGELVGGQATVQVHSVMGARRSVNAEISTLRAAGMRVVLATESMSHEFMAGLQAWVAEVAQELQASLNVVEVEER